MVRWVELIRLETGEAPRFNDSAADAAPLSDAVLACYNCTATATPIARAWFV